MRVLAKFERGRTITTHSCAVAVTLWKMDLSFDRHWGSLMTNKIICHVALPQDSRNEIAGISLS
jgi:hypothetical protein